MIAGIQTSIQLGTAPHLNHDLSRHREAVAPIKIFIPDLQCQMRIHTQVAELALFNVLERATSAVM